MNLPRWARRLGFAAGLLATAGAAAGLTWLLREQPWKVTVPYLPDTAAEAADAALVADALAALPAASGRGPDLVLIVLDTVRADHLELYGYPYATMPRLATWAREALVYERAVSTSSWTLPAHASLFTGQLPALHGAHGRVVAETGHEGRRHRMLERPLRPGTETLASRLQERGYATLGIVANKAFLDPAWGLDQGFDLWICEQPARGLANLAYIRGDRVTSMALAAVDGLLPRLDDPAGEGRAPFFLFVNYMEGHAPYVAREGYVRDPSRLALFQGSFPSRTRAGRAALAGEDDLPARLRAGWEEAYDAELRFLDEQVGRLLAGLDQRGIGQDAFIVILSDHGEYFGEHRLVEHSKDLYEPGLRIPLLARGPDVLAGRTDELTEITALPGWLLERAGGEPLPPAPATGGLVIAELYGSRSRDLFNNRWGARFNRVRRAYRRGEHKVILGSDGSFEAYDLATDPEELTDLRDAAWARELAAEARAWESGKPVGEEGGGEEEERGDVEALRELGYIE
ncbi:MAG: sulfatase [Pseudomonadota bacterium]